MKMKSQFITGIYMEISLSFVPHCNYLEYEISISIFIFTGIYLRFHITDN